MLNIIYTDVKYITIFFYVLIALFIYINKPSHFFDKNGNFLEFGTSSNKTIFPMHIFLIIIPIFLYFIFLHIEIS
jgi:hypothetical protein